MQLTSINPQCCDTNIVGSSFYCVRSMCTYICVDLCDATGSCPVVDCSRIHEEGMPVPKHVAV